MGVVMREGVDGCGHEGRSGWVWSQGKEWMGVVMREGVDGCGHEGRSGWVWS